MSHRHRNHVYRKAFLVVLSSWALLVSGWPSTAIARPRWDELESYIVKTMDGWEVPGLAISVVKDGELVYARGFGVRRLGEDAPVDENTLFAVASNTKAFTAAALGILVQEGKLDWMDRVIDSLPSFRLVDPYVTREIRVVDLLTHRSGLPRFGGDHLWIGQKLGREEIVARLRHLEMTAPFRTTYQYQNLMFLVAGQIVPARTEKSWDEFIKERFFKPLGMSRSNTSIRDLAGDDNVAAPHEKVDGKVTVVSYDDVDSISPAGGINSSVTEMASWMLLHLGEGEFEGERILEKSVVREMQRVHMPIPISDSVRELLGTQFSGYGLGWGLSDYRGRKLVAHGGGLSGMNSRQTLVPEEALGILVVTNFAPNNLTRALTLRILDSFLGEEPTDWSAAYLEQARNNREKARKKEEQFEKERLAGTRPSLAPEGYTGSYSNPFSGTATVRLENGSLLFDYNSRHRGKLTHWHHDTFRVVWEDPIYDMPPRSFVTFTLGRNGAVEQLTVEFYRDNVFKKKTS